MLNINRLSILCLVLFSFSLCADDMIESQSIRAKVIDIEKVKTNNHEKNIHISIELDGEVKKYSFSPFKGAYVFYKRNSSTLPIMNIKLGHSYNIELGTYSSADKKKVTQKIYYIGDNVFSFGELE